MYFTWMDETPVGRLLLAGRDHALQYLLFDGTDSLTRHRVALETWCRDDDRFAAVVQELTASFAGELKEFQVPVQPEGTEFQQLVWSALRHVPYGETATYGEIAAAIGRPRASRAVGLANGCNPVSIMIPCHRIIGTSGKLVGYGSGLSTKERLLSLEGARLS